MKSLINLLESLNNGQSKNLKFKLTHLEIVAASGDKDAYLKALKFTYIYRVITLIAVLVAGYFGLDIPAIISKI